jgi:BASS family bile acid:Na+ symporter
MEPTLAIRVLVAAYLATMMFSIGLAIGGEPKLPRAERRQARHRLVRALLLTLVVLPVAAWAILHALDAHGTVALALLVLAVAPGGRFVPALARHAQGEVALATETTLWLTKLTAFTAPPTLALLGESGRIHLDDLRIIALLIGLQLLPFLAGRTLRRRRPAFAAKLTRPFELACTVLVVAVLAVVAADGKLAALRWLGDIGWLAAVVFAAFALALGWLCGGPTTATRRSFSLLALGHDLALALALASLGFPHRHLGLPLSAIWLVTLGVGFLFAAIVRRRGPARVEVAA